MGLPTDRWSTAIKEYSMENFPSVTVKMGVPQGMFFSTSLV